MTDVALVFVNWNTGRLLLDAVNSLFECSTTTCRYRLVVVDNGSSDDSIELIEARLRPLLEEDSETWRGLDVVALPENLGFAKAVNVALARVEESFAVVLNTDIRFCNDVPALLVGAIRDQPSAALACPRLLNDDLSDQAAVTPFPTLFTELTNRSLARRLLVRSLDATHVTVVPAIVGPCMALDMDRIRQVGFLDDGFFFFFEETDWCRRIGAAGYTVLFVPSARLVHFQGGAACRRPYRARIQFYQSRYRYFRKHYGQIAACVLQLGLTVRLGLNAIGTFLLTILSIGRARYRDKFMVYFVLLVWHMLLCLPEWGLRRK